MSKAVLGIVLVFFAVLTSCKRDKAKEEVYALDGRWEIYEAYRNNELTNTLEDGYFEFQDSVMETNILGSPIVGPYSLSASSFTHDSSLPVEYRIMRYTTDSMEIDTEIRRYKFTFKLEKQRDSIPAN